MASTTSITIDKLMRLVGMSNCPTLIDVRTDEDFGLDPRLIPGSRRRPWDTVGAWSATIQGTAVLVCQDGRSLSEGCAAWQRQSGVAAEALDGGAPIWFKTGLPMVPEAKLPPRDREGRNTWVTRARPNIDRIACPWLIRRFVNPNAAFLFVAPAEVMVVAKRFGAAPFDVDDKGVFWSHGGEFCTFDVMVQEFGLGSPALDRLATIVRAADTARPELAHEAPGLLAASLGLSRMFSDDLPQLDAGMLLYDAFYRWRRDATAETQNWPINRPERAR